MNEKQKTLSSQVEQLEQKAETLNRILDEVLFTINLNLNKGHILAVDEIAEKNLREFLDSKAKAREELSPNKSESKFRVGQMVEYVNHVIGYYISNLVVVHISEGIVTARSKYGECLSFDSKTGIAKHSCNLSIRPEGNHNAIL